MSRIHTSTRSRFLGILMGMGLLLAPFATAAAEPPAGSGAAAADGDFANYTFEDERVFGDTVRPTGEVLRVRPDGQRESLVRTRDSFVRELLESVEAL